MRKVSIEIAKLLQKARFHKKLIVSIQPKQQMLNIFTLKKLTEDNNETKQNIEGTNLEQI